MLRGLELLGIAVAGDEDGSAVRVWQGVMAAGVAVAAYSAFFSTPLTMLTWPVAVGMLAHALRWAALTVLAASNATGAFVACLFAGLILTPVARRWHMPFASIACAAAFSMMPGGFLFWMASGLVRITGGSPPTS